MLEIFEKWYRRYFFEEESILLLVLLVVALVLLMTVGDILAPVLAAIVLAYLAEGLATRLQSLRVPRMLAVAISFLVFLTFFFGFTLGLMPLVWRQLVSLAGELPGMLDQLQQFLVVLPERYPTVLSEVQLGEIL
ncbi:MAG: AI-2E family transporter, partial [Halioglobus sp.]|nr:AI-2E family transporter [Halioglobus sp.]